METKKVLISKMLQLETQIHLPRQHIYIYS